MAETHLCNVTESLSFLWREFIFSQCVCSDTAGDNTGVTKLAQVPGVALLLEWLLRVLLRLF